jgi:GntR family transcriptional regulator, transcriptional repressor for pyruvate dehydrogenase complex
MSDDSAAPDVTPEGAPLAVQRVRPAYEQVAAQLRDLIVRGEIMPGQRLPVESELPALFGVSRSTIREALRVLSSQNLVATRRGVHGGTFVVQPQCSYVGDFLEASLGLMTVDDAVTVDELIEVRAMLEVPAARLAASRRTDTHVKSLRAILSGGLETPSDSRDSESREFHQVIVDAAGNALLEMVTRPIFGVLQSHFEKPGAPASFWAGIGHDHTRIVEAIDAGDEDAAAHEMLLHLEHLRTSYRALEDGGRPPKDHLPT